MLDLWCLSVPRRMDWDLTHTQDGVTCKVFTGSTEGFGVDSSRKRITALYPGLLQNDLPIGETAVVADRLWRRQCEYLLKKARHETVAATTEEAKAYTPNAPQLRLLVTYTVIDPVVSSGPSLSTSISPPTTHSQGTSASAVQPTSKAAPKYVAST